MLIVCPSCTTSYDVDAASLGPNGRQVRCARCLTVWHAEPSRADKLMAAAEALGPVRRTVEAMADLAAADEAPAAEIVDALWTDPAAEEAEADASAWTVAGDGAWPDGSAADGDAMGSEDAGEPTGELADDETMESPPTAPADLDDGREPVEHDHDLSEREPSDDTADHEPFGAQAPLQDIETLAARRAARRAKREAWQWPLSRLQSAILVLLVVNAVLIGWRVDFVRVLPQTASFYAALGLPVNLRGIDFADVSTGSEVHDNVPILVVAGNIINRTGKIIDVPHLKFVVRNAARQEIYSWTAEPPRAFLPPGEAVAFHTRLASPPPDIEDVLVRFVNRYDFIAGGR